MIDLQVRRQLLEVLLGRVSLAIYCIEMVDQQCQDIKQLPLVSNDYVDVPALQLDSEALPIEERHLVVLAIDSRDGISVLAQHPEPTSESTIADGLDLAEVKAGVRLPDTIGELVVFVHLLVVGGKCKIVTFFWLVVQDDESVVFEVHLSEVLRAVLEGGVEVVMVLRDLHPNFPQLFLQRFNIQLWLPFILAFAGQVFLHISIQQRGVLARLEKLGVILLKASQEPLDPHVFCVKVEIIEFDI